MADTAINPENQTENSDTSIPLIRNVPATPINDIAVLNFQTEEILVDEVDSSSQVKKNSEEESNGVLDANANPMNEINHVSKSGIVEEITTKTTKKGQKTKTTVTKVTTKSATSKTLTKTTKPITETKTTTKKTITKTNGTVKPVSAKQQVTKTKATTPSGSRPASATTAKRPTSAATRLAASSTRQAASSTKPSTVSAKTTITKSTTTTKPGSNVKTPTKVVLDASKKPSRPLSSTLKSTSPTKKPTEVKKIDAKTKPISSTLTSKTTRPISKSAATSSTSKPAMSPASRVGLSKTAPKKDGTKPVSSKPDLSKPQSTVNKLGSTKPTPSKTATTKTTPKKPPVSKDVKKTTSVTSTKPKTTTPSAKPKTTTTSTSAPKPKAGTSKHSSSSTVKSPVKAARTGSPTKKLNASAKTERKPKERTETPKEEHFTNNENIEKVVQVPIADINSTLIDQNHENELGDINSEIALNTNIEPIAPAILSPSPEHKQITEERLETKNTDPNVIDFDSNLNKLIENEQTVQMESTNEEEIPNEVSNLIDVDDEATSENTLYEKPAEITTCVTLQPEESLSGYLEEVVSVETTYVVETSPVEINEYTLTKPDESSPVTVSEDIVSEISVKYEESAPEEYNETVAPVETIEESILNHTDKNLEDAPKIQESTPKKIISLDETDHLVDSCSDKIDPLTTKQDADFFCVTPLDKTQFDSDVEDIKSPNYSQNFSMPADLELSSDNKNFSDESTPLSDVATCGTDRPSSQYLSPTDEQAESTFDDGNEHCEIVEHLEFNDEVGTNEFSPQVELKSIDIGQDLVEESIRNEEETKDNKIDISFETELNLDVDNNEVSKSKDASVSQVETDEILGETGLIPTETNGPETSDPTSPDDYDGSHGRESMEVHFDSGTVGTIGRQMSTHDFEADASIFPPAVDPIFEGEYPSHDDQKNMVYTEQDDQLIIDTREEVPVDNIRCHKKGDILESKPFAELDSPPEAEFKPHYDLDQNDYACNIGTVESDILSIDNIHTSESDFPAMDSTENVEQRHEIFHTNDECENAELGSVPTEIISTGDLNFPSTYQQEESKMVSVEPKEEKLESVESNYEITDTNDESDNVELVSVSTEIISTDDLNFPSSDQQEESEIVSEEPKEEKLESVGCNYEFTDKNDEPDNVELVSVSTEVISIDDDLNFPSSDQQEEKEIKLDDGTRIIETTTTSYSTSSYEVDESDGKIFMGEYNNHEEDESDVSEEPDSPNHHVMMKQSLTAKNVTEVNPSEYDLFEVNDDINCNVGIDYSIQASHPTGDEYQEY